MAMEHKKLFQEICLRKLVGDGGRSRYNFEAVAAETGIPARRLRQFKSTGMLGDSYCDRLAQYLFGVARWTDALAKPQPTQPEKKTSMEMIDLITRLIGDVALLRKEIEDLKAQAQIHHPTQGGAKKNR
jgi:hypothetical protein